MKEVKVFICHNMVVWRTKSKVKIPCQHLEFSRQDYLLRCTLDTLTLNRYFFLEIELILSQ